MRALTRGAMQISLYDVLTDRKMPEKAADDIESDILAEFERLGGGKSDGNQCI